MVVPSLISIPICLLAFISSAAASPAASPTPVPVCNNDNCNRALRASISAASSFCATYTTSTVTATTGIPTYIPSTCGPSRISSACTCVVTKSACAFNAPTQVVQDPGFEATPDPNVSDSVHSGAGTPWLATDTTGDDFFVQGDGYSGPGFWYSIPVRVRSSDPCLTTDPFSHKQARLGLRLGFPRSDRHRYPDADIEFLYHKQVRFQCLRWLCRSRPLQQHHHRIPRQHRAHTDSKDVQRRSRLPATDLPQRSRGGLSPPRCGYPITATERGGAQGGDLP